MKQVHGLNMLKEYKENKVNLGKKAYEEEMEELCVDYLIPLLKKHITDETKTPTIIKALNTFEDNGYTNRDRLTKEEDRLNFLFYLECLGYTKYNTNIIISDLKEETKIDLIVNEFINGGLEEELYKKIYE